MKKSRYTDRQILAILQQNESGMSVPDLCREHGMSKGCFYPWRSKFSGLDASRMKALEDENRRLKKMYAEERLRGEIAREALEKQGGSPLDAKRGYIVRLHTTQRVFE
jgi:putative transposase